MDVIKTVPTLSDTQAMAILESAHKEATDLKIAVSIAITDANGDLLAFRRMEGATFLSGTTARDKAWTAAGYKVPTHEIYEFIKTDESLSMGVPSINRLMVIGGGYPIIIGDVMVGAIGVGGGHYSQDMQTAKAGLNVIKTLKNE